jgi:hypothetical protein
MQVQHHSLAARNGYIKIIQALLKAEVYGVSNTQCLNTSIVYCQIGGCLIRSQSFS